MANDYVQSVSTVADSPVSVVAVMVAVADVVSGVAMILARYTGIAMVLGAAVVSSLPRLIGTLGS